MKIVPNDKPNDDGKWVTLPESVKIPSQAGYNEAVRILEPHLLEGFHIVMYERGCYGDDSDLGIEEN